MAHGGKNRILATISRLTDHIANIIHHIGVVSRSADHCGHTCSADQCVVACSSNKGIRSERIATEVGINLALFGVKGEDTTTARIGAGKQEGSVA